MIIVLFYPSIQEETVDKITKTKDCCFSQQNENFQLDCSVRNPYTNGACEIKTYLSWITTHFMTSLNALQSSNSGILDPFQQILCQIYPNSVLQSSTPPQAVRLVNNG